jgi:indole-3-glycerol phosphate synthase
MNILDKIIEHKKQEVAAAKALVSLYQLQQTANFKRQTFSLQQFLLDANKTGIIAEFKRKSPSKGSINNTATVLDVTTAYTANGASALSILTDGHFFGGSIQDVHIARVHAIPILRKEFIIDSYQIAEAKAMGADVILLIAACLSPLQVKQLASYAQSIGLEVLLELHTEDELAHICDETNIVGINNRDLKTFTVDMNRAIALSKKIPNNKIKIAESGINDIETIRTFKNEGYHGFLIGENFMKQPDPAIAFAQFVQLLQAT